MIEKERLSDRLRRGEMSVELAVLIARQVAAYLRAYHDMGRPHGALDPSVIVLENEQHASVSFADEKAGATTSDDVRALGTILFRMVTGLPPTGKSSTMRTWRPGTPAELDALVTSMLATDRPSIADVLQRLDAMPIGPPEPPEVTQLRKELVRATSEGDPTKALETVKQLIETDRAGKPAWYFAAGELCQDLQQRDEALDYFNYSLDAFWTDDPTDTAEALRPLEAIERMLSEASDWKQLERSYRKMAVRMRSYPTHAKLQAQIFRKLGEVYRTRLNNESSATGAFGEARRLDPSIP